MYMPGRLRTASRPSRTVMSFAPYDPPPLPLAPLEPPLRAPAGPGVLFFLLPAPRWEGFATQLPFDPIRGCLRPSCPGWKSPCEQEGRGLTKEHKSLAVESPEIGAKSAEIPCKSG